MAIEQQDSMAQFEAERAQARERNTTPPFFFSLKNGDKALVRLLLNFDKNVRMDYHEHYNAAEQKYDVNAVCAQEFGQECAHCEQAKTTKDWKLKAQRHVYIPVYVHNIKRQRDDKTWAPVTYKEDGVEKPVSGVRMLDMKLSSSTILDDLQAAYLEDADKPSDLDITRYDFVISRRGAGLETNYTVTAKPGALLGLPAGLTPYTQERVKTEVEAQRPMKTVGSAEVAEEDTDGGQDW